MVRRTTCRQSGRSASEHPAHAGVGLGRFVRQNSTKRAPCARRGWPLLTSPPGFMRASTLRTQGLALPAVATTARPSEHPAHAGVGPPEATRLHYQARAPCARRGWPRSTLPTRRVSRSTLRTQGLAQGRGAPQRVAGEHPAHAGVGPARWPPAPAMSRAPCARRGWPAVAIGADGAGGSTLRAQGLALTLANLNAERAEHPARAGVGPSQPCRASSRSRAPCARRGWPSAMEQGTIKLQSTLRAQGLARRIPRRVALRPEHPAHAGVGRRDDRRPACPAGAP